MVLGLCRLLLRDPTEAEDATQQVFLAAHRALLGGAAPREAQAWLGAIARNECRARKQARHGQPIELAEIPSDLPDPLAAAIRATDLQAIWAAISSLPRRQRRALLLREVGGLSYRELGRALGITETSVESLLFRARRQVRSLVLSAVPAALRHDLARLIPGFDPGPARVAGGAVTLPIALKLATAVAVGVVTTGAARLSDEHAPPPVARPDPKPAALALTSRARPRPVEGRQTVSHEVKRQSEHRPVPRADRERQVTTREADRHTQEQPVAVEPTEQSQTDAELFQTETQDRSFDSGSEQSDGGAGAGDG